MRVDIVIGGCPVVTIDRPEIDDSRGFHIHSRAKVCPKCLEVWALMRTEKGGPFGIESQFCEGCRQGLDGEVVPGSLLDDRVSWTVDWDLIRYLPVALLQREFELHVRAIQEDSPYECTNPEPLLDTLFGPGSSEAILGAEPSGWSECPP
jgi:hypothetical protein